MGAEKWMVRECLKNGNGAAWTTSPSIDSTSPPPLGIPLSSLHKVIKYVTVRLCCLSFMSQENPATANPPGGQAHSIILICCQNGLIQFWRVLNSDLPNKIMHVVAWPLMQVQISLNDQADRNGAFLSLLLSFDLVWELQYEAICFGSVLLFF